MTQLTLNQTTRVDAYTAYYYIRSDTVICCGGSGHNEVYEVNIRTGSVDRPPNMNAVRTWTGIWFTRQQVFVFGGSSLNTAEKYGLDRKPWSNLPNPMPTALNGVSVCEHSSGLYLAGQGGSGTSFVHFNLDNEAFRLIRSDPGRGWSFICCLEDELYHIYAGTIEAANLSKAPAEFNLAAKGTFPSLGAYYLCCPMKFRGGEFITALNQTGGPVGLLSFIPTQNKFTKVSTFAY